MKPFEVYQQGYQHKNLIFWVAMLNAVVDPVAKSHHILDFGCGQGVFLRLLYDYFPYETGFGIDVDQNCINYAKQQLSKQKKSYPIHYLTNDNFDFEIYQDYFDIIFCQEILWCNEDITEVAKTLYGLLKPNGQCYMTVGCHSENPMWIYRKNMMKEENIATYTHHLDEIAQIFSDVGFVVGMRRLPLDGFVMFNPNKKVSDTYSFSKLVKTTYENKMLFYFEKSSREYSVDTIQG